MSCMQKLGADGGKDRKSDASYDDYVTPFLDESISSGALSDISHLPSHLPVELYCST